VTSSWTLSPNISHPMMAMEQSRENWFLLVMWFNFECMHLSVLFLL
jgi:hypothetical protein